MAEKIAGIGDEAVENATGEPWAFWLAHLDGEDGRSMSHKERVAALAAAGVESGWWQQQLAVGYEHERGLREVGETADAGYEIGVQRTLPIVREQLWDLLTSPEGLERWLGETSSFAPEPGTEYRTADGTTGEVRTVKSGERVRLTWQPEDRGEETTLQLTLSIAESDDRKTVLRVHHERLHDSAEREAMREHWRAVLDGLDGIVDEAGGD